MSEQINSKFQSPISNEGVNYGVDHEQTEQTAKIYDISKIQQVLAYEAIIYNLEKPREPSSDRLYAIAREIGEARAIEIEASEIKISEKKAA